MPTSRREFLRVSMVAGSAVALGAMHARAFAQPAPEGGAKSPRPLSILILGGTGFIGPEMVSAALARGHTVTLFNRGLTEKRRGGMFDETPGVTKLYGNRDPEKHAVENDPTSPKGLESLKGGSWDAVIDNSGFYPRLVAASAEMLAPVSKQYVFISSISAYADSSRPGSNEDAPLGTLEDPTVESMGPDFSYYGPLKVLCEKAVQAAYPGRATIVRPGFIVGSGDFSGRFNYWPLRCREGGEMLAPGTPDDPIQLIDARDLADFVILCVENETFGVFNANGGMQPYRMGEILDVCKEVTGADTTFTWVPASFLAAQGVIAAGDLPIWIPPEGESAGFHQWSNKRAVDAGLRFRPLDDTVRSVLTWYDSLEPGPAKSRARAGWSRDREDTVLKAWHEHLASGNG